MKYSSAKNLTVTAAFLMALGALDTLSSSTAFARDHERHSHQGVPYFLNRALDKLPASDAEHFRASMRQAHETNNASIERIHVLHDDIDNILAAQTFDKDAFTSKSAELRQTYDQMRATSDEAFANALAQLPQHERKILVSAMTSHHDKRP